MVLNNSQTWRNNYEENQNVKQKSVATSVKQSIRNFNKHVPESTI